MISVARCRGRCRAVKVIVGDGRTRSSVVCDDEHATRGRELAVVHPDTVVVTLEIKCISSPNDLGVDLLDLDTLDDDILGTIDKL